MDQKPRTDKLTNQQSLGTRVRMYYPSGETEAAVSIIAIPLFLTLLYASKHPNVQAFFFDVLPYGVFLFVASVLYLAFFNTRQAWFQEDRIVCANLAWNERLLFRTSMKYVQVKQVTFTYSLGSRRRIQLRSQNDTEHLTLWMGPIRDEITTWRLLREKLDIGTFDAFSLSRLRELEGIRSDVLNQSKLRSLFNFIAGSRNKQKRNPDGTR